MTPEEKLAAKRANEGVKALAGFFNNLAVGILIAGLLAPWVAGHPESAWVATGLVVIAGSLHLVAQFALRRFLQPEE